MSNGLFICSNQWWLHRTNFKINIVQNPISIVNCVLLDKNIVLLNDRLIKLFKSFYSIIKSSINRFLLIKVLFIFASTYIRTIMIFGYARVSTKEQNLNLQIDALKKAGSDKIFQEKVSGRSPKRPELLKLLEQIRPGDTLIVFSVDRLGRTTRELIMLLNDFKEKGITFKSLSEGIFDTSSPMGEAIFQIIAILKTMEVNVLRERTIKGIEAARARGKKGGRPVGSYNKKKASAVVALYNQKNTINFIEDNLNISRSTIYQYLRNEGVVVNGFTKSR